MAASVMADPGDGSRSGLGRRYAVPALLVVGWGGLFAYSAAYLTEDLPFRAPPTDLRQPAETGQTRSAGRRVVTLDLRDGDAPEAPRQDVPRQDGPLRDAPRTAPGPLPVTPVADAAPAALPASRPPPGPALSGAEYVGTWGPTAAACAVRSRRRGFIPATIAQDHARAGRTVCAFHDSHRVGAAWVMAATCSDRGRHWSSQVRLVVEGDRLTWSSSRGTVTYLRCGRRTG